MPLPEVLRLFRQAGATSVAVTEDTIGDLEGARRIRVEPSPFEKGNGVLIRGNDALVSPLVLRIADAVIHKTRLEDVPDTGVPSGRAFGVAQPYALVRGVGVGLDPDTLALARTAGLGVIGRVYNWEGVTPNAVRWTLDQLKKQNVRTIIFSGDEVLGFKGYVAHDNTAPAGQASTEDVLRADGLFFGAVEFVKQKGNDQLARAAGDRVVRVHTVPGAEMVSADVPGNVQRFLLAARERNIRLLFVRLFASEPDALNANLGYVQKIARGLARGRLEPGPAHGFRDLQTGRGMRLLMGAALAAGWLLLADAVTGLLGGAGSAGQLWPRAVAGAGALGLLVLPALSSSAASTGAKLAALASACIFPSLALLHADLLAPDERTGTDARFKTRTILELAFRRLLTASGITLMGALLLVGLLADRLFLIKADWFTGIKFSQLIPILVAAVVYFLNLHASDARPWPRVLDDARQQILRLATQPILLYQVAAALAAFVVLALVVLRSGNDPGVGVSAGELKVRALLDQLLYTRPRFKEFLIGHPAMIVGLALAITRRRKLALPFLLVGALGQVSMLNTFCHLHTPLLVSLLRALLGFTIGAVLGTVAYLILVRLFPVLLSRPAAPAQT